MAKISDIKAKLSSANSLGIANLAEKRVELPEGVTTYDIMRAIADIGGGGIEYTSLVFNGDNTVTMLDSEGETHLIEYGLSEDVLSSVKYDGKEIALTYNEGVLVKIGRTVLDTAEASLQVDGEFQNGFALGLIAGGVVEEGTEQIELMKVLVGDVTSIQQELEAASEMLGGS